MDPAKAWHGRRLTWDVRPVVFDVHFMQAGLGGRVLDGDGPVQVVGDGGPGGFTRGHEHLTWQGRKRDARHLEKTFMGS